MFSLIFCKSYKKLSDNSLRVLLKKISKNVCSPISKNILAFFSVALIKYSGKGKRVSFGLQLKVMVYYNRCVIGSSLR